MTLSKSGVSRWPALPITLAVRVCVCVCVCVSRASPDGQLGVVNLFTDDGAILLSPELLSNAQRPSAKARIGFVTRRRIHVLKSRGGSLFSKLPFLYPFDLSPLLSFPFCPSHLLPCTCPSPNLPGSPLFVDRASPDCSTPCVSYYTCTEFVSPPLSNLYMHLYPSCMICFHNGVSRVLITHTEPRRPWQNLWGGPDPRHASPYGYASPMW